MLAKPNLKAQSHGNEPQPRLPRNEKPNNTASDKSSAATVGLGDARARGLEMILALEAQCRASASPLELAYLAANDFRKVTGARQTFLLQTTSSGHFAVKTVSSLATIERDAPLIRWIERLVARMRKDNPSLAAIEFSLPAYTDSDCEEARNYPFRHCLWQPLALSDGTAFAGILQTRERPFSTPDKQITVRLAATLAHSWRALTSDRKLQPNRKRRRVVGTAIGLTILLAGALPVPMTTIAPIEIAARNPIVITAPLDGVIDAVERPPNSKVAKGDTLFRFEDTTFRNKAKLAEQELKVAKATHHKTEQAAFSSQQARYQLAITRTEYELKKAELTFANELLAQSVVAAPASGVLIYPKKSTLEGHPVTTGEAIMKIADPREVKIEIELPVADAIVLRENAHVRVFLDTDPLSALEAKIVTGSYQATPQPSGQLAYELTAEFTEQPTKAPRIGARGTAQIFGETTTLAFFLLRRPIAAIRQTFGF
jgi:multidrug efflux pump subunit AcrA (membrane-fusion protein)